MAKLLVTQGGQLISEHPILKECLTIGRKPDNDIVIDHVAISGHHAHVITLLNESFVEDLDSTNGTFVNGRRIQKYALHHGDVINLGEHQITYFNPLGRSATREAEVTRVVARVKQRLPKQAPPKPSPTASLRILNGVNSGRSVPLTKSLTTLGKPGEAVAAISRKPKGYFIIGVEGVEDEQRMSINGEPLGTEARPLKDNDVIEISGVKMQFNLP